MYYNKKQCIVRRQNRMFIDFDRSRSKYTWRILESNRYIFHIEPSNMRDYDLEPVLMDADYRYSRIVSLFNIDKSRRKEGERLFKYNYWIHSSEIVEGSGLPTEGEDRFTGMGSASIKGIDYVIFKDSWKNHKRRLLHEEAHLIWMNEVGEAPSILNEGIAVYAEDMLTDGVEEFRKKLQRACNESMVKEKGRLFKLMNNRYFWRHTGSLPINEIGAALVDYIIRHRGVEALKEIFLNTHLNDEAIDRVIEKVLGISVNEIENEITAEMNKQD